MLELTLRNNEVKQIDLFTLFPCEKRDEWLKILDNDEELMKKLRQFNKARQNEFKDKHQGGPQKAFKETDCYKISQGEDHLFLDKGNFSAKIPLSKLSEPFKT